MALACLVQIDGYDPVAGTAVTLRAASRDDPAACHLNGQTWWPAIAKLPTLRYDLFDGAFGGQIAAPASSLTLAAEPWPDFGHYALADARFRLWTGELGDGWAGYTLRFDGRVTEQPALKDGIAQVAFAVDDRWLDAALLPTYAGTTGIEGPAALKGQAKPLSLGAPRYVPGTLIDSVNSVFQVSFGPIQAVEVALERLVRFGPPIGDYSSYAALVAAAIPRGTWGTCLALGLVRFGAPPSGQVSFLVRGDVGGPDGWARLPGRLIRRLALLSGGAGKIDDASLAALDAARPYNQSLYLDQQTTARQLIQQLAASVNAVAGVSWTGQLFVIPVALSAPTITLAADGSSLPPVGAVEQIGIAAPWSKLAIGAERAWSVHALADIAFTAQLLDLGPYDAGTTYREGNIVQYQGSSWLYQNPTATAGNAPPGLPTEQDGFWRVLAKAGAAGAKGNDGRDAFIMAARGTAVIAGNQISKPTGADAWDSDAYSTSVYRNGAVATFQFRPGYAAMAGLNADPTADASYGSLDFAWYCNGGADRAEIYENGVYVATMFTGVGAEFNFRVEYDGRFVHYYVDQYGPYRSVEVGPGKVFYFDSSLYNVGARISNVTFLPRGADGSSPVVAYLTNESFTVPSAPDGTVGAFPVEVSRGQMKVFDGSADVTAQCTFTIQNPLALDGRVDADGSYYAVGLYADAGYSDLVASYKGKAYSARLTASKSKAGANAPDISIAAAAQAARFDKVGTYVGGSIAFTTVRKNTADVPRFTIRSVDGTAHGFPNRTAAEHTADYPYSFQTSGPDNLVLTAVQVSTQLAGPYGNRFTVTATAGGVQDIVSVVRVNDGADGNPGTNGTDGYTVVASQPAMVVQALNTGAVKTGELPRDSVITVKRGNTDISGSISLSVSTSPGITASGSGNIVTLSDATSDGTITVGVIYAGVTISTIKIPVNRQLDAAPPQSQTSATVSYTQGISSTTYGAGVGQTILLQANSSGGLGAYLTGRYAANGSGTNRSLTLSGKLQYRIPGGGWSDFGPEVAGDEATFQPGEPNPATIRINQTVTGLSSGQTYEVQGILRISARSGSGVVTTANGQITVQA